MTNQPEAKPSSPLPFEIAASVEVWIWRHRHGIDCLYVLREPDAPKLSEDDFVEATGIDFEPEYDEWLQHDQTISLPVDAIAAFPFATDIRGWVPGAEADDKDESDPDPHALENPQASNANVHTLEGSVTLDAETLCLNAEFVQAIDPDHLYVDVYTVDERGHPNDDLIGFVCSALPSTADRSSALAYLTGLAAALSPVLAHSRDGSLTHPYKVALVLLKDAWQPSSGAFEPAALEQFNALFARRQGALPRP